MWPLFAGLLVSFYTYEYERDSATRFSTYDIFNPVFRSCITFMRLRLLILLRVKKIFVYARTTTSKIYAIGQSSKNAKKRKLVLIFILINIAVNMIEEANMKKKKYIQRCFLKSLPTVYDEQKSRNRIALRLRLH
jgi:accessory gene regulator protein AgrB